MGNLVELRKNEQGIAILTLLRTDAANALSIQLLNDLQSILNEVKTDRNIRVAVITGAGEKAFCAGADLKERRGMNEQQVRETVALIPSTINAVEALPQPVIAAINGVASGGGLELALDCDVRIAAEHAQMGLTETSWAIIPGAGGTQRLPRLISVGRAKELIYTARRITAEEAYQYGIVEHVVPYEELMNKALSLAEEMAVNAPLSLIQAKAAINKGIEVDLHSGLKIEELAYNALIPTEDRLEGLRAFAEKRPPQYKGR